MKKDYIIIIYISALITYFIGVYAPIGVFIAYTVIILGVCILLTNN